MTAIEPDTKIRIQTEFPRLVAEGIALSQSSHHSCRFAPLNRDVQPLLEECGRSRIAGVSRNPSPQIRTGF